MREHASSSGSLLSAPNSWVGLVQAEVGSWELSLDLACGQQGDSHLSRYHSLQRHTLARIWNQEQNQDSNSGTPILDMNISFFALPRICKRTAFFGVFVLLLFFMIWFCGYRVYSHHLPFLTSGLYSTISHPY